ncbi:hypothetical protein L1987_09059 [Smallanthus sonchifolius]|uniref:Uncharacterized protein n=1 Tax=Smallanthus sonchifolius TaxID=185202 RepID=A0ACB9JP08_9ASTR|nr:hypothetical protein L1987_09059 [Smallanthus sonchifolius]
MVARRKRKKTTGPPPELSSKGKRVEGDDDLDQTVSKPKKQNVSRPKLLLSLLGHLFKKQLQIESLTASLENALKQLATQGESSCRQETVIIPEDDDDDTEGAQGNKGDGQQGKENVDKESLECLIDLDSVIVDDWDSDAKDVEIVFEKDNEVIKYATHEGVEFDTLFINEIN